MKAEELSMDKEMVRQILTTDLNMKKCVPKWSQRICKFLPRKHIAMPEHTVYSPDLAFLTFFFSQN
jgi:hypothetical protein